MNKAHDRTKNVIVNSISGSISAIVSLLCNYIVRIAIAKYLGDEIFGINSMFTNLISNMQILDVGFGSAIIIHLYKAIAENDYNKINDLVTLYRKIYKWFAIILFCLGLVINYFFISDIIKTSISYSLVQQYFVVFLVGIVIKYLTSYKTCILYGDQKNRIITNIKLFVDTLFVFLQLVALYYSNNFYFFLILKAAQDVLANLLVILYVNKSYPNIKVKKNIDDKELGKRLISTVKPLALHRASETIISSSCSLIMGISNISVVFVGYYSNYLMICNALSALISQVGTSLTSSYGNLAIEGNKHQMKHVYEQMVLVFHLMGVWLSTCFCVSASDFICMLFGETYKLSNMTVVLISIQLYLTVVVVASRSIQNATGSHSIDAKAMIVQAFSVIILSILGGKIWGLNGILIGNIVPQFLFSFINKNMRINNVIFEESIGKSVKRDLYFLVTFVIILIVNIIAALQIKTNSYLGGFLAKGVVAGVVTPMILFFLYHKRNDFQSIFKRFLGMAKR